MGDQEGLSDDTTFVLRGLRRIPSVSAVDPAQDRKHCAVCPRNDSLDEKRHSVFVPWAWVLDLFFKVDMILAGPAGHPV